MQDFFLQGLDLSLLSYLLLLLLLLQFMEVLGLLDLLLALVFVENDLVLQFGVHDVLCFAGILQSV